MKLKITVKAWGISRNGSEGYKESVVETNTYPCEAGELPETAGRRSFVITSVSDDSIELSLPGQDGKPGWPRTIKLGEKETYRPRSMDGGHIFVFELAK